MTYYVLRSPSEWGLSGVSTLAHTTRGTLLLFDCEESAREHIAENLPRAWRDSWQVIAVELTVPDNVAR